MVGLKKWTCNEVDRRLEAYLDGEVGTAVRVQMEAHLEACQRCRGAAEAVRDVGTAVREAAGEAALTPWEADVFWPVVRARIREAEAAAQRWSVAGMAQALGRGFRWPVMVPALAALVGIVVGVGILRTERLGGPAEAAEVQALEAGPASTVMLFQEGGGKSPVIWIFEDGAGAD